MQSVYELLCSSLHLHILALRRLLLVHHLLGQKLLL